MTGISFNKTQSALAVGAVSVSIHQTDDPTEINKNKSYYKPKQYIRQSRKIGRNEPCPCRSGKKYKKCCLLK